MPDHRGTGSEDTPSASVSQLRGADRITWELLPLHVDDRRLLQDLGAEHQPIKRLLMQGIVDIRDDPYGAGVKMQDLKDYQVFPSSLAGCYTYYCADYDYFNSWRIVYQINDDERTIQIVAIGRRMGSKVYKIAMERLAEKEEEENPSPRWKKLDKLRRKEQRRRKSE